MTPPQGPATALPRARTAAAILVAIGVLLLLGSTFAAVVRVRVGEAPGTILDRSGWDRHGPALAALALLALPLAAGALRGARPAAIGLAAVGLAALAVVLAVDLPALHDPGAAGTVYEDAAAGAGPGWFLETAGAVALVLAGGGLALLLPGRREERDERAAHRDAAEARPRHLWPEDAEGR